MSEAQQPLNALPQGHRLQEYELVRVLGFGGFGMTYLGFDHHLDKAVAIKEYLPSDIATRTAAGSVAPQASDFRGDFQWGLKRFVDEGRTLARFDHRHIIKVHRFFEAHDTAYIVMEYAEGETLSAFLERKGTLTEAELQAILYPLLDGLEVVHGADFLHRDIKPGNIVLRDADHSPVLLDFGAARQAIGEKSRSITVILTPGYAPFEQYSSRGHQGPWTDIYALGAVCYRALTGQVPDDATDRVRNDPLIPVSQQCTGQASQAFLSAIDKALSVDEGDRPQSVGTWREALEAGSTSAPVRRQAEGESHREQAAVVGQFENLQKIQTVPLPNRHILSQSAPVFGNSQPPSTYAEWAALLDRFAEGEDGVLDLMEQGKLEWGPRVKERFVMRVDRVFMVRKKTWLDTLNRHLENLGGNIQNVHSVLSSAHGRLRPIVRFSFLKIHPDEVKAVLKNDLESFLEEVQDTLEREFAKLPEIREQTRLIFRQSGLRISLIESDEPQYSQPATAGRQSSGRKVIL